MMVSFTGQEVQGRIQLLIIKQKNSFLLVEMVQKSYYPYPSDKPEKKYFIITSSGKSVYFGQQGYNDYIIYNKNEGKEKADKMKKAYIASHSKMGENWGKSGRDTAEWRSDHLLWNLPTFRESYNDIQKRFL